MKVGIIGLDLPLGKVKYHDERFVELVKKCDPLKVTPYYVEFVQEDWEHADAQENVRNVEKIILEWIDMKKE